METWLVIGISGVTNGGKTTLAKSLESYLLSQQGKGFFKENLMLNRVVALCQDDYFLPVDSPKHCVIEKLNHINWEILSSLDMERMCYDIMKLLGHKFILYNCQQLRAQERGSECGGIVDQVEPMVQDEDNIFADHFLTNFLRKYGGNENGNGGAAGTGSGSSGGSGRTTNWIKKSKNEPFHNVSIKLNVLLLEGFLLFNHPITLDLCGIKFHIHLPYEKCYSRRLQRVYDPPDVVGYFEMCVWPMYEKHYKEFKDRKDIYVLNGEIPQENIFNYVLNCIKDLL
ncbi:nicotinamide riboside kinase 2 [Anopheles aquasalis]|uniref:nicotinamide riboside kinase 2 n=1 Tax=Anopheles aquasalis TaxID=42839 RepID=UPI00215AC7B2|nr:nicotinamide riboside kinase 2 [Anopheles aquasalis]XP_050090583.1 nicotinamide riboside kinase 2 [Anopheles aquasalis]